MTDKIKFAKLRQDAIIPTKRDEDGCYDVYACFDGYDVLMIEPGKTVCIPTGICSSFDSKYRISVRERGSTGTKGLKVSAGQIDSGYRGEYFIPIYNTLSVPVMFSDMEYPVGLVYTENAEVFMWPISKAIAQLAVEFVPDVEVIEVDLDEILSYSSIRGEGKLGSSGK